jgi:hypothetical protein
MGDRATIEAVLGQMQLRRAAPQPRDQVEFGYQAAQQDSFSFVATWVRRL